MNKLPNVICSSVIRSSHHGDSHGGIYLLDLDSEKFKQVVDWNDPSIDWSGRGADRGLRGIAFYDGNIICAASDEIFIFNQAFEILNSFRNKYLKHCHEIHIWADKLYLTSTGFDSILVFDLKTETFEKGYTYRKVEAKGRLQKIISNIFSAKNKTTEEDPYSFTSFDPNGHQGPHGKDTIHVNNVFYQNDSVYFSGKSLEDLMKIKLKREEVQAIVHTGIGTHNVSLHQEYCIYNNTGKDSVTIKNISDQSDLANFEIRKYDLSELLNTDIPQDHARQGFGRGLCFYHDYIIGGSSPSTITVYSIKERKIVKTINITMDIRNAIHGLEIYPYEFRIDDPLLS
ncbi:MAG: hypothetical protein AAF388_05270 [Bacteroidota bacterium]